MKKKDEVTFRVAADYLEREQKKFNIATWVFFGSTILFFLMLAISVISSAPAVFDVALWMVVLVWFPSLGIAATASKHFDDNGGFYLS